VTRPVPHLARQLAAELELRFAQDAKLAKGLNDAEERLRGANDRLWSGLGPDGMATVYGEHPAAVNVALAKNAPASCARRTHCWRGSRSTGRSTKRTTTPSRSQKTAATWRPPSGRLSAHSSTSWWRPAGLGRRRATRTSADSPAPKRRCSVGGSRTSTRFAEFPEPCTSTRRVRSRLRNRAASGAEPGDSPAARWATSEGEEWRPAMSSGLPPARPRHEHPRVERIAYLKLIRGKITADRYREAIVPRLLLRQRRRHRGRG
jgi:hypothetical protein